MYDRIKIRLYDLPDGYDYARVLSMLTDVKVGDDGKGFGRWRGRNVVATANYVQLMAVFLNVYSGIIWHR